MKLFKPEGYDKIPKERLAVICNGCGPSGWKVKFNSIIGCNVSKACNIHDYMYLCGVDIKAKKEADRVFLNNMLRLIDNKSAWKITKWMRKKVAYGYYISVKRFGGPAFWAGKNK